MEIRHAGMRDLEAVHALEKICFPPLEAASKESFRARISAFPNHFWLMYEGDTLICFVNGFVTDRETLTDEMFENASLHDENGAWQMIFGVDTHPDYRNRGCASSLLEKVIEDAKADGRKGVILTCKEKLISFYARLGFETEGLSVSEHGGAVWYQMKITF